MKGRGNSLLIFSVSAVVLANLHVQCIFCGHSWLFLFYLKVVHIIQARFQQGTSKGPTEESLIKG